MLPPMAHSRPRIMMAIRIAQSTFQAIQKPTDTVTHSKTMQPIVYTLHILLQHLRTDSYLVA
jgi:hypothetical protein